MTKMSDTSAPDKPVRGLMRLSLGLGLALFVLGLGAGVGSVAIEKQHFGAPGVIGLVLAIVVGGLSFWLIRGGIRDSQMPKSPRMRRSRIALYVALGISFAGGLAAAATAEAMDSLDSIDLFFTSSPVNAVVALAMIACWLLAMGASTYWHTTIDEFERAEYEFGASVAIYAYMLIAPVWWMAARGGLLPPVNGIVLFWIICALWSAGWAWKRYR